MIVTALTRRMLKQRRANRQHDQDEQVRRAHLMKAGIGKPVTMKTLPSSWPFPSSNREHIK